MLDLHPAHWNLIKEAKIREILEEKNINLLFLPPSSSAMNPIEHVWAIFKREWSKVLFFGNGAISYNWARSFRIADTLETVVIPRLKRTMWAHIDSLELVLNGKIV